MEKKITIREFLESKEKIGIRCDTIEEAVAIHDAYCTFRNKQRDEFKIRESMEEVFFVYDSELIYCNDGSFCNLTFTELFGYTIYEFDEVSFNMDFSVEEGRITYPKFIATTSNLNDLFNNNWFELSKPRKGSDLFSIICDKFSMPSKDIRIKGVYPNKEKKIVVVKWCDDTITKVACSKDDEFDLYIGVALAISYKMNGSNTQFRKYVDKLTHWQVEKKKKPKKEEKDIGAKDATKK